VIEIVASYHGNAWRATYTVRLCFARLSKEIQEGYCDVDEEIELIKQRLAEAERDYRERQN
jgi:hypothetical protein